MPTSSLTTARLRKSGLGAFFRPRDVQPLGISFPELQRLVSKGTIEKVGPGLYRLTAAEPDELDTIAMVASAVPTGIICLLSALSFHGIGTQLPSEVWLAIERGKTAPRLANVRLRIVRYSGAAFSAGIETHVIERQRVRVYGVAKTLADLFKARNRVGLDVAVEALREAWRDRRFTIPELDRAARACRVERVMRPYVEGVVA